MTKKCQFVMKYVGSNRRIFQIGKFIFKLNNELQYWCGYCFD